MYGIVGCPRQPVSKDVVEARLTLMLDGGNYFADRGTHAAQHTHDKGLSRLKLCYQTISLSFFG